MNNTKSIYDIVGIGIGPFNLGLASLINPLQETNSLFIDNNTQFNWHYGLLLSDATLQVPFLADLVTLADPTNKFSFLNYLKEQNRLYKFYFYENFFALRQEYNHYCQWVANNLPNLLFNTRVINVEKSNDLYKIELYNHKTSVKNTIYTKHISIGVGTSPNIPAKLEQIKHKYVKHSAHYLDYKSEFLNKDSICVVGSGQSAGEIILDLLKSQSPHLKNIYWITSSKGFFPMEYSKLGLEHFSPDYMNYFYNLDTNVRKQTINNQDMMYKGISKQTIADIFDELYKKTIANQKQPVTMIANCKLKSIKELDTKDNSMSLELFNKQNNKYLDLKCSAVILATGYKAAQMDFLDSLDNILIRDENQSYALNSDFSIKTTSHEKNKLFMQNNSLFSHGIGSPDLGLTCYRNSVIINTILEKEIYPTNSKKVFQDFDLSQLGGHNEYSR